MMTILLPDHLRRFPCMHPWIGSRYQDKRHKRLLVIGESHYLPPDSTIHHDPDRWYPQQPGRPERRRGQMGLHRRQYHRPLVPGAHHLPLDPERNRAHTHRRRRDARRLPPQPHRLLQLLPAPRADRRRQHARQRTAQGPRNSRRGAQVVHPAPPSGAGNRDFPLRRSIRRERTAQVRHSLRQYAPSWHSLVEHGIPKLRPHQRPRFVLGLSEDPTLADYMMRQRGAHSAAISADEPRLLRADCATQSPLVEYTRIVEARGLLDASRDQTCRFTHGRRRGDRPRGADRWVRSMGDLTQDEINQAAAAPGQAGRTADLLPARQARQVRTAGLLNQPGRDHALSLPPRR